MFILKNASFIGITLEVKVKKKGGKFPPFDFSSLKFSPGLLFFFIYIYIININSYSI